MYKLTFVIVLLAVFATVQMKDDVFEECRKSKGVDEEELRTKKINSDFWCSKKETQEMAECFLKGYEVYDGETLNEEVAKKMVDNDQERLEKIKGCCEEAEKFEKHLRGCTVMDCFERKES